MSNSFVHHHDMYIWTDRLFLERDVGETITNREEVNKHGPEQRIARDASSVPLNSSIIANAPGESCQADALAQYLCLDSYSTQYRVEMAASQPSLTSQSEPSEAPWRCCQ